MWFVVGISRFPKWLDVDVLVPLVLSFDVDIWAYLGSLSKFGRNFIKFSGISKFSWSISVSLEVWKFLSRNMKAMAKAKSQYRSYLDKL